MEVLKHGNTYKEVECPKCGALLSYCKADIEYRNENQLFCIIHKEWITCPECNERIMLKQIEEDKF